MPAWKKNKKYLDLDDNGVVVLRPGQPYWEACCDCGLTHERKFYVDKDDLGTFIVMHCQRDNRKTSAHRRERKKGKR